MPSNSAEYMRAYRARRKEDATAGLKIEADLLAENVALTEEVARLKRELAKQGKLTWDKRGVMHIEIPPDEPERPFPEFRPVPKPAKRK